MNNIRLDSRIIIIALLLIIVGMLAMWKPWEGAAKQTITVTGEGTISAAPDEFQFYPTYEKKAAESKEAISQVSTVGNEVVAKLKELGVAEKELKTNVSTNPVYTPYGTSEGATTDLRAPTPPTTKEVSAQFSITATVHNKDVAQKILDYLATTPVLYGVSPQSTFRTETRKKLESEARGKALIDASSKADQTVSSLGAKRGRLVSVSDLNQYGGPIMLEGKVAPARDVASSTTTSPVLETGTQDLSFSVTVVYQIR